MNKQLFKPVLFVAFLLFNGANVVFGQALVKAGLQVSVFDTNDKAVPDAQILLFANQKDYESGTHPVTEAKYTNAHGKALYVNLVPGIYYVQVTKDGKDNSGGGVITEPLKQLKIAKIRVVID